MRNKYLHLLLFSNALIVLDQYTKILLTAHVPLHYSVEVIEKFFSITHIRNPGVAFGLFANLTSEYKALIFIVISLVAIMAILMIFHQTPVEKWRVHWGLILIFSGAVGNLIDRILYEEVIDFLDFQVGNYHWPAFNIADACITIGVGFMVLDLFRQFPQKRASSSHEDLPEA